MPEVLFDFEKMRQFKSDYFAQKTALTEPLHDIAKKINFQFFVDHTSVGLSEVKRLDPSDLAMRSSHPYIHVVPDTGRIILSLHQDSMDSLQHLQKSLTANRVHFEFREHHVEGDRTLGPEYHNYSDRIYKTLQFEVKNSADLKRLCDGINQGMAAFQAARSR